MQEEFLQGGRDCAESDRILAALEALPEFQDSGCVLMYMDLPGEVRTADFVKKWASRGKRVVLPRVMDSDLELRLYDSECLVSGFCGVMEPSEQAPLVGVEEIELAVVPGIAFSLAEGSESAAGVGSDVGSSFGSALGSGFGSSFGSGAAKVHRLGHGGGFYDRLLPKLNCPLVGLCFPFRLVESLPLDEWDCGVDLLLY